MTRHWQQQIRTTFVLPAKLLDYVSQLQRSAAYDHKMWDTLVSDEMKEIRRLIYSQLWRAQKGRCAYCGMLKFSEHLDREHFLPKRHYLKLMFHPYNIVLACKQCNRDIKKTNTPLSVKTAHGRLARKYGVTFRNFSFKYWHPYFHDPADHFTYSGAYNAKIQKVSDIGSNTIRLFGWDKTASILARAQNEAIFEKLRNREITPQDLGLVGRIMNYKNYA